MTTLTAYEPSTTTVVADYQTRAVQRLGEWATCADAAFRVAQRLVETAFVPQQFKSRPMEATAAILAGAEVGLSPMASLRSFDIIQGQAAPRAISLRAIVQSYGHEMVLVESTNTRCRMRGRRRGTDEWQTSTWTEDRARGLGLLGKDNWKKQPGAMLVARATSELARLIAADAILGIGYTAEEVADDAIDDVLTPVRGDGPDPTQTAAPTGKRTLSRRRTQQTETPPEDTNEPVEPEPDLLSGPQLKKVNILLRENGYTDREAALIYVGQIVGREITSTKTLTKSEAHTVIEFFEAEPDPSDTPTDTLPTDEGER